MENNTREYASRKQRVICSVVVVLVLIGLLATGSCTDKEEQEATNSSEVVGSEVILEVSENESSEIQEEISSTPEESIIEESVVVENEEPTMLPDMAKYYEQNPEIVGWLWVEDTKLNYPIMYTPEDPEKYIHLNFEEEYDVGGLPFVDAKCSMDPRSDNLIIYGHNMMNGTQFGSLMDYAEESYWQEHQQFHFSTLYETKTYEVVAAFYDRVYYKHEDVFKFYQFIDAEDEEEYNNAIENYHQKALYDTDVTAQYGDDLITLVTCSYHTDNGRFVVVGKAVDEVQ